MYWLHFPYQNEILRKMVLKHVNISFLQTAMIYDATEDYKI